MLKMHRNFEGTDHMHYYNFYCTALNMVTSVFPYGGGPSLRGPYEGAGYGRIPQVSMGLRQLKRWVRASLQPRAPRVLERVQRDATAQGPGEIAPGVGGADKSAGRDVGKSA